MQLHACAAGCTTDTVEDAGRPYEYHVCIHGLVPVVGTYLVGKVGTSRVLAGELAIPTRT